MKLQGRVPFQLKDCEGNLETKDPHSHHDLLAVSFSSSRAVVEARNDSCTFTLAKCRANSTVMNSNEICLISIFCRLISQVFKSSTCYDGN